MDTLVFCPLFRGCPFFGGRNVFTILYRQGGEQFVHCREVVQSSECPLSEVPLYISMSIERSAIDKTVYRTIL